MPRIAILIPDLGSEAARTRWAEVLARNAAPLRTAGIKVEGRDWAAADDLADFDLVLPLLAWGYPQAPDLWLRKVEEWENAGVKLANPAPVLRWNADKLYLGRLAGRGAPVVPTHYVEHIDPEAMRRAAARLGSATLIAKPRISSSAWRTIRWREGGSLEGGPIGPAMIQPYLSAIESEGEISLFYFGGRFSHAIRKVPRQGDFRVQPEYRGVIDRHDPAPDELAAAEAILAAVDEPLLYARVDLVRDSRDGPLLIELELIEPDLYLEHDPGAGGRFAAAALRRIEESI